MAYAVQRGGSDWRTIRVVDVATGSLLKDELQWARFTQIAWARDEPGRRDQRSMSMCMMPSSSYGSETVWKPWLA